MKVTLASALAALAVLVTSTPNCNEPIETPTSGLAAAAGANVANDPVVFNGPSPHGHSAFNLVR